jgi:hypothetical protein
MTEPATPSATAAPTALDRARALIEPQLRLLGRLAEIGLDVAETVGQQARGETEAPAKGDLSLAFARVSRAVRLTVALQQKLVDGLEAMESGRPAPKDGARPDPDYVLKARVERIVERTAEAEHDDDEWAVDRLVRETAEGLDDIDLYGDLLDRPISEIVARIARDIGLPLDWSRLAEEAWARTEMQDGETGEPLAALLQTLEDPPPLDPPGPRRALRLAATARRGRRAEKAKARGEEPEPEDELPTVTWVGEDGNVLPLKQKRRSWETNANPDAEPAADP